MPRPIRITCLFSFLFSFLFLFLLVACDAKDYMHGDPDETDGDENATPSLTHAPSLSGSGALDVAVVLPSDAGAGLKLAAADLRAAMAEISGVSAPEGEFPTDFSGLTESAAVEITLDATSSDLGVQDYRIEKIAFDSGQTGLQITARTETGAMYGLYALQMDLGVRYIHPQQTVFPSDSKAALPWTYEGEPQTPHFELRGFHEHTQHPIVASDIFLKPGNDDWREMASDYLKWLARNRQNAFTFHMLKTVDLDTWIPYITEIVQEGQSYGIHMGLVLSFADQQQNGFKLIADETADADAQIEDGLKTILDVGFDVLVLQIGTSEFTKVSDETVLGWMDTAIQFVSATYPEVEVYTWIHPPCDLFADGGGYYYHLPLQADPKVGAFLHTTMYYDMDHPAPVYACEDFSHQKTFLEEADGKREIVFFPETAWWLGFDNNCPVVLPITGWSRAHDIDAALSGHDVKGHVTFTSGREWTYWMYDHFLTRKTWDGSLSWDGYLEDIGSLYGENGMLVTQALSDWTALQKKHFYDENPLIYFYISGELRLDEIGESAGILARRPKLAYKKLVEYDDDAFNTWKQTDFEMLSAMLAEYKAVLETLPAPPIEGGNSEKQLYNELYNSLYVFTRRIEHAIANYAGVVAVRDWVQEVKNTPENEEPSQAVRTEKLNEANARLSEAKAISTEMIQLFGEMESQYRHPVEMLAREKQSLTGYQYGYLYETSTGHFWTRRDDQLEILIGQRFHTIVEEWTTAPDVLFYTDKDHFSLTQPDSNLASSTLTSFIPRLLFGPKDYDGGEMTLILAQDYNENLLPEPGSELPVSGNVAGGVWEGSADAYTLTVHNSIGEEIGELVIFDPVIRLTLETNQGTVTGLTEGELIGTISGPGMVDIVVSVTNSSGLDEEGATILLKSVWGIDSEDPLPDRLPFGFAFTYVKAE